MEGVRFWSNGLGEMGHMGHNQSEFVTQCRYVYMNVALIRQLN